MSSDPALSRFEIQGPLGEGGMGVLYRARDTRLGRTVAIKFLRPEVVADPERRRRFEQEAKAASALNHPNIVTLYDIGEDPERGTFIAMECLEGESLKQRLARGALPVPEALRMAFELARGLAAAHEAGIVHRDFKPANVMVTSAGHVKVLDFGLAKLVRNEVGDTSAATRSVPAPTAQGIVMGTPAYMSPEQAEGRAVEAPSDVFSFGCVLFEMLTGRRPFEAGSEASRLTALLRDPAPPVRSLRPDVGADVEAVIRRCLEKDPAARYPTAAALRADLEASLARLSGAGPVTTAGRRSWFVAALLLAGAVTFLGAWAWKRVASERRARRETLPEIARLTAKGELVPAFGLAEGVRPLLVGDAQFDKLWIDITLRPIGIRTEPAGARVSVQPYSMTESGWRDLGETPLENQFLPMAPHRFRFTKPGFVPVEAAFMPMRLPVLRLVAEASAPKGMVFVPGGEFRYQSAPPVELPDFWLDRFEVTNQEFQAFVDAGGYARREVWKQPFLRAGKPITFEEAMALFRDTTGRPGPSAWALGSFPEGRGEWPVSGVSWYEALAYAEFAGKALPTLHHWYRAADLGLSSEVLGFSNFGGEGPGPVGARKSLTAFGNYDMAGNVREWVWNAGGDRRYTLGGAWSDPSYLYTGPDALDPMDRSPILGLRCARYDKPPPEAAFGPISQIFRDFSKEQPVKDELFQVYRGYFDYDRSDLEARVEAADDRLEHWRVERVSYSAAYGEERIPAHLYIPKKGRPPFQTVIYSPPASALFHRSSDLVGSREFDFLVRSGRAVLFPVYQHTYERRMPDSVRRGPHFLRDLIIQRAKDLRRSIDYVESRPDLDPSKVAYYGLSMGADMFPLDAAVEPRLKTGVMVAGSFLGNVPPEVDSLNYAPRVKVPVLMINGRYDFMEPLETSQRPLFRLLGTPAADKRHVIFESGHVAPWPDVVRETLDWLDRYLGPVSPGGEAASR